MLPSLPNQPSLDHLRHQARDLQRDFEAGKEEALQRVREGVGGSHAEPGSRLRVAQAQCVVAREYGFPSWPKLRDAVLGRGADREQEDEPLHVWYASRLLLGAISRGMLELALSRRDEGLFVEGQEAAVSLAEFVRHTPILSFYPHQSEPVPVDDVWERLLVMADMAKPEATEGTIRVSQSCVYPYTNWNIRVSRLSRDQLGFRLELDHIETTPPSPKTGERETPGGRLLAEVVERSTASLSPETEHALAEVAGWYDAATFHRGAIREIAEMVPAGAANPEAMVACAHLAAAFPYHTGALVDIARIVSGCASRHSEFVQLAELAVRRLWGTLDMVRLARELAATQSEEDIARIHQEIAGIEATADYASLAEAWDQRENVG